MSESEPDESIATAVTPYDKEANPENVTWGFLTTGKATGDGILWSHHKNFKYHKRDHNHAWRLPALPGTFSARPVQKRRF